MIYVCSLTKLTETVERTGARRLLSLVNEGTPMTVPPAITPDNHLFLAMNDIIEPIEGMTPPGEVHVRRIIDWAREWDRRTPLVVHCFAGISRSTAAAYVIVAALNPDRNEAELAKTLRHRSPSATPNRRIVAIADDILGRGGRMLSAIDAIGRGEDAYEGTPFRLELQAR